MISRSSVDMCEDNGKLVDQVLCLCSVEDIYIYLLRSSRLQGGAIGALQCGASSKSRARG